MPTLTGVPLAARDAILAWYGERGRPLAFRRTLDPYAILVSEAMAQQTQAARAADHWERFMDRFPTLEALAAATPADVLRAWQGLGYDRRALALWRTARIVVEEHGGRIPSTLGELQALPGIGLYTARAVAALAFGIPVGAVDVNVRRVLGRIVAGDAGAGLQTREIQRVADEAVPADRPGAWTHALMDVGATLCRPRSPRCDACPARPWCRLASQTAREPATSRAGQRARPGSRGLVRAGASAPASPRARALPATPRARALPPASPRARNQGAPFASTNRWLRGRILDRARAVPDGEWVTLDTAIGAHDADRVRAAADAMAADGVLELAPVEDGDTRRRARLPLA